MAENKSKENTKTHYFFKDKEENLVQHFRLLYETSQDCDVIFVSQEKCELKAHKLILSLGCEFFKELFESTFGESDEIMKILLPQYRYETIEILLKFLYTGEIFVPPHLIQEFIDICLEFNCDTIIDVDILVKNHKIEIESVPYKSEQVAEWLRRQEANPKIEITKVELPKQELMDMDDYFEVNRNVEAIYLDENNLNLLGGEEEFAFNSDSKKMVDSDEDSEEETEEFNEIDELKKENGSDEETGDKVERVSYRTPDGEGTNPLYDEQLKKACDDVMENGISFLTASRKYGITRSVIHRHVQRLRQGQSFTAEKSCVPGPSEAKNDSKVVSWWEKINPSWNVDPEPSDKHSKKSKSKIKYKNDGSKGKNPEFVENLRRAVDDVMNNGASFWQAHKKYGITRSVIHRHVQRIRQDQEGKSSKKKKQKKMKDEEKSPTTITSTSSFPPQPVNIMQLREELSKFKERLQNAINACRNDGVHVKKASKMFDVPVDAIERNLKGFKRN